MLGGQERSGSIIKISSNSNVSNVSSTEILTVYITFYCPY